ncbi:hypothetical protein X882_5891 [Burkholderia pseudomallei MSHR4303]|nr:hypothetical protein X882_5891 [Burkholderia pseudomallei MSHR4303]
MNSATPDRSSRRKLHNENCRPAQNAIEQKFRRFVFDKIQIDHIKIANQLCEKRRPIQFRSNTRINFIQILRYLINHRTCLVCIHTRQLLTVMDCIISITVNLKHSRK